MLRIAEATGDADPEWIKAVATTVDTARKRATPGSLVLDDAGGKAAFLVVMKGTFTIPRHPPGCRPPTGGYQSVVIDSMTFRLMDRGLSNHSIALDGLGPVTILTDVADR
jgi:hypothetical protein